VESAIRIRNQNVLCRFYRLTMERELSAEKKTRVEIAEHEIGIGDRGRDTAAPVAGGTWPRHRLLQRSPA